MPDTQPPLQDQVSRDSADVDKQEKAGPPKPAITFPDGGAEAWLAIVGCFLLSLTSYGQLTAFGTFTTYYAETLLTDHSVSSITWIGSVQLTLTYVSGLMFGRIFDAYGSRPLLVPGCLLSVFSLMMTSLATTYYQVFLAHGIGVGLGIAMQFYPLMALPSHWFFRRRALAVVSGASLSGVIYPAMLSRLIDSIGFPWAVRTMAFFNLAIQVVSIPLAKDRLPRNMKLPLIDLDTFKEPIFMVYAVGGFLFSFGESSLYPPLWYIELFALSKGLNPSVSFYTISVMNASGLIGRILVGFLGDKFGKFNMLIPITILGGVWSLAVWSTAEGLGSIIAFCVLFGFTSASVSSIAVACTGQLTPHPSRIGARVGIFSLFMAPGILAGPSIAGAILDSQGGDYLGLQIFVGLTLIVGAIFVLVARVMGLRGFGKF
ncbi:hypothetical protein ONZ45_g8457 [Pleurotus djamor]|nr:hypothetical protein ONZ45_g8457 [Pleurotus djamor]